MHHKTHGRDELGTKLRKMYSEIDQYDLDLDLEFSHEKDAWVVTLRKGEHELATHLEKKDADQCLEGVQCVYLGVQIGQFVKNFEAGEE